MYMNTKDEKYIDDNVDFGISFHTCDSVTKRKVIIFFLYRRKKRKYENKQMQLMEEEFKENKTKNPYKLIKQLRNLNQEQDDARTYGKNNVIIIRSSFTFYLLI